MKTDFVTSLSQQAKNLRLRPREELKEDVWESGLQYVRRMGLNPVLDQRRFYEVKLELL